MIRMRGKTYVCSGCGWKHDEIDVAGSMPPGMLNAFSNPPELDRILRLQSVERVSAALTRHEQECPARRTT